MCVCAPAVWSFRLSDTDVTVCVYVCLSVAGRPEVVLQAADKLDGPWKDIEFRYKPGDVETMPPFLRE